MLAGDTLQSITSSPTPMPVRAAIMPGPNEPLTVIELPLPALEPGAALLRTLYSEVCGTDVHLHRGKLNVPFPIIPEIGRASCRERV